MATVMEGTGEFEMGRVVQRTFETIVRNFGLFAVASLILIGVPNLLFALLFPGLYGTTAVRMGAVSPLNFFLIAVVVGIVWILLTQVLQAVLIRATVFDLAGQKADLGETLAIALKLTLPLIGLAILVSLGIGFASILLIFPGIMLYCAWAVAVPALVEERQGVLASLSRSSELTKGYRWKIFALVLVYLVIVWVISAATGLVAFTGGGALSMAQLVLRAIISSATTMISAAGVAAMYVELRASKEGASFENLAEIFS